VYVVWWSHVIVCIFLVKNGEKAHFMGRGAVWVKLWSVGTIQ